MAVIRHFEATAEERAAYLKQRRLMAGVTEDPEADEDEATPGDLSQERYAEMSAAEDLILTIHRGRVRQAVVIARLSGARARRTGRGRDGQGHARRPAGGLFPRSISRTRSCWRPLPASRSAFRSRASPSGRDRRAACASSTPGPGEEVVSVAWIADPAEDDAGDAEDTGESRERGRELTAPRLRSRSFSPCRLPLWRLRHHLTRIFTQDLRIWDGLDSDGAAGRPDWAA